LNLFIPDLVHDEPKENQKQTRSNGEDKNEEKALEMMYHCVCSSIAMAIEPILLTY
jgi:hypothetical protein